MQTASPCTRQAQSKRRLLFRRFALVASSLSLECVSRHNIGSLHSLKTKPQYPRRHKIRFTSSGSPALAQSALFQRLNKLRSFSRLHRRTSQLGSLHNLRLLGLLSLRRRPRRRLEEPSEPFRGPRAELQPRPALRGLFLPEEGGGRRIVVHCRKRAEALGSYWRVTRGF